MSRRDPRRGRVRRTIIGALVVLAVLWVGYWFAARYAAAMGLDRVVSAAQSSGRQAACDTQGMAGFPLSLDVQCVGARFADPAMSAKLGKIAVTAPLYRPGRLEANLTGPFLFNAPDRGLAVTAAWEGARATADAGLSGLSGASAAFTNLSLEQTGTAATLPFRNLAVSEMQVAAAPGGGTSYRLTGSARDVVLESPSGRKLPTIAADLDVAALNFGSAIGLDPRAALHAWIAGGGSMEVNNLTLFLGDFSASATGPLSLSADGLLSGDLTVRFAGLDRLPDLAETLQPGTRDRVATLVTAVSALTRLVKSDKGEARQIALSIRDGRVRAGLLPIATIPALRF